MVAENFILISCVEIFDAALRKYSTLVRRNWWGSMQVNFHERLQYKNNEASFCSLLKRYGV